MNSISWQDAFLIFKRWRDNHTLVFFAREVSVNGESHARGETGWIMEVESANGIISSSNGEFDLLGAAFEYRDNRDSPFPDAPVDEYEESIEASFEAGETWVFGAMKDV